MQEYTCSPVADECKPFNIA